MTTAEQQREELLRKKFRRFVERYYSQTTKFDIRIPQEKGVHFVKSIVDAINNDKKIFIYGDYDVDGLFSVAFKMELIYAVAKALGKEGEVIVDYKIPTRAEHYGIKYEEFKYYLKEYDLIITSDNGTHRDFYDKLSPSDFTRLIIVDHHPLISLPMTKEKEEEVRKFKENINVINPNIDGSIKISTGMLDEALFQFMRAHIPELAKITDKNEFSDLSAITLISDMADKNNPIVRKVIKEGLKRINKRERAIYQHFFPTFGSDEPKPITVEDIGFKIAPIFNSGPRMSNNVDGLVQLILEKKLTHKVRDALDVLVYVNEGRKEMMHEFSQLADEKMNELLDNSPTPPNIAVLRMDGCPIGLNGLIAGNMAQTYGIPTVVVSENIFGGILDNGEFELIGSGRGEGIKELVSQISNASPEAKESVNFGGHKMAIGIRVENWNDFASEIQKFNQKPYKKLQLSEHIVFNEEPLSISDYEILCHTYNKMSGGIELNDTFFCKVEGYVVGFNEYRNGFKKIVLADEDLSNKLSVISRVPKGIDLTSFDKMSLALAITPTVSDGGVRFADIYSPDMLRPNKKLVEVKEKKEIEPADFGEEVIDTGNKIKSK